MILGLIKSVLKSLELYLSLRNKAFYRDLVDDHRNRERKMKNEIEKLRDTGDPNDALRADLMRDQILAERKQFESISAAFTKAQGGGTDSNG